jgi:hypothetical protein
MLSIEIVKKLEAISTWANKDQYTYLSNLLELASSNYQFVNRVDKYDFVVSGTNQDDLNKFTALNSKLSNIPVRGLFSDLEKMDSLIALPVDGTDSPNLLLPEYVLNQTKHSIEQLTKALEYYLARKDDRFLVYGLFVNATKLSLLLETIMSMVETIRTALQQDYVELDETVTKRFSIHIPSNQSFEDVLIKLTAIRQIYFELAGIMGISVSEHPIEVIKIEAGSLWVDILGYPKIIEFLEKLANDTISYFYRNFTTEGKISALPKNVETIEAVLHLRRDLKAVGINTDDMDEILAKSSVVIAQQLNNLLLKEARIRINEQEHWIGDEYEQKYLEAGYKPLLPSGENTEDTDKSE